MALSLSLGEIPEDNFLLLFTLLAECILVELLQPFASLVHCVDEAVEEIIERKDFRDGHYSQT